MRLLASSLALGATVAMAAVAPGQQPLGYGSPAPAVEQRVKHAADPLAKLKDVLGTINDEASALWAEMAAMFPESVNAFLTLTHPKPHTRKPDSHWDHITRGADIHRDWEMNAQGESERRIEGKLHNYNMRTRRVDPSGLGVDPGVKQFSGYLDDEEEDKHLFYWFFESRNDPKKDPVVLW